MAAGDISDLELRRQLKSFGQDVGPVTVTTRGPLLRKLKRLQNEHKSHKSSQIPQNEKDVVPSSTQGVPQSTPSKITVRNLPLLVVLWLGISSVVCTIDALFVLLRPHTLPGGKWNYLFQPYNIYIEVDTGYKDLKDSFVIGQSWMNLVEVCLNIITIVMYIIGRTRQSVLFAFMVSTMTSSKTALFILISSGLVGCHNHVSLDNWKRTVLLFILPNGIWIVLPVLCMVATGKILVHCIENCEAKMKQKLC